MKKVLIFSLPTFTFGLFFLLGLQLNWFINYEIPVCNEGAIGQLHPQRVNDMIQFWDDENNPIIITEFKNVNYEESVGLFTFEYNKKWGLATDECEIRVEAKYDYIRLAVVHDTTSIYISNNDYSYFIDEYGKRIDDNNYDYIIRSGQSTLLQLEDSLEPGSIKEDNIFYGYYTSYNGKDGYTDVGGNVVIPTEYNTVSIFNLYTELFKVTKDGLTGIMNKYGEYVLEPKNIRVQLHTYMNRDTELFGIINSNGVLLTDAIYEHVSYVKTSYDNNQYIVVQNGLYGVLDSNLDITIPIQYTLIRSEHRHYKVESAEKDGVMKQDGTFAIPLDYVNLLLYDNAIIALEEYGKVGLLDYENNILYPFGYYNIEWFDEDTYIVQSDDDLTPIYVDVE